MTFLCSDFPNSRNDTITINGIKITFLTTWTDIDGTCRLIVNAGGLLTDVLLSMTCRNVDIGTSDSISFQVSKGTMHTNCAYD